MDGSVFGEIFWEDGLSGDLFLELQGRSEVDKCFVQYSCTWLVWYLRLLGVSLEALQGRF